MKIIVAFDKFKGTLTAPHACETVARVLAEKIPRAQIVQIPLADGGDGTAAILHAVCGGRWNEREVTGPLPGSRVRAGYAELARPPVCVVEMAAASGIALLAPGERDPLRATTRGTGELLAAALKTGRTIWLAVGGSATVDAGTGAARALGWRFLDSHGNETGEGGGELERIAQIVPPPLPLDSRVEVLCDVTNPLCGPDGAAHCFGPQKGATPAMVERLERGMLNFAAVVRRDFGLDLLTMPGGGAAGGLPAGARLFFNATSRPGIAAIMEATGLPEAIRDADWVLTGEGSFDAQSLSGKVVSGLLEAVRGTRAKIAVIAGRVGLEPAEWRAAGIASARALAAGDVSAEEAMRDPATILRRRAAEFAEQAG